MKKLHPLLGALALLLVSALALSACGSSGGSGDSDEDKVVDVIEASTTTTDPADCDVLFTGAFLEQVEGAEGDEALEECEEDIEDGDGNPDSIDVTDVEIEGSSANANVAFVGGDFDGQTINIGLVEEDGDWKMDQLEEFVAFDKGKILAVLQEGIDAGEVEAELGECIIEELDSYSDEELEESILEGFSATVGEVAESCQ